ncbi:unnamed protein product, partial [Mesorhabditis belari]|uniref:40S ribosomal protein S6 n=1 Tax=Mesorhabditis belari TaxID=2138241 RepID=A0AAF3EJS9_9BILA
MKLLVSYPATGQNKVIDIEDEKKIRPFYEKRMAQEVEADALGDEWKGYVVRISGGNDKQGFPMMQGVLTNGRVRLLLKKGQKCYRQRRTGERKRKSVRGCIVDQNLSILNLVVVKKGEQDIEGLTDTVIPRVKGPKRATKIRKLFNLDKEDDVRKYVIRHDKVLKNGKTRSIAPKIQRLVTPRVLQHRRQIKARRVKTQQREKEARTAYSVVLAKFRAEQKERRKSGSRSSLSKK